MAALRPAAEAPATRTSQFTGGGGTEDEIKVSGGDSLPGCIWPGLAVESCDLDIFDKLHRFLAGSSMQCVFASVRRTVQAHGKL